MTYKFPTDPENSNEKDPTCPLFWEAHGISDAYRDAGFRYYDQERGSEHHWRAIFDEYYADAPDHIRKDARFKMSTRGPGILQLRAVIKGLDEDRPIFPQIRPNQPIVKPPDYVWHGTGPVPSYILGDIGTRDEDTIFVPLRYFPDGGYRNFIRSDRTHDHGKFEERFDPKKLAQHIAENHSGDDADTYADRHAHPEPIVGDRWFTVLLSHHVAARAHINRKEDMRPGDRNFGGHSGVNVEGLHLHYDEGKYHLPPNPKEVVSFAGKRHRNMDPGERAQHVTKFHGGEDKTEIRHRINETQMLRGSIKHTHSRTVKSKDPHESQAARVGTHPLFTDNLLELIERWGFCFVAAEGSLKGAALASAGYPVLIVASVTTWIATELEKVCKRFLRDTTVIVVPDADWALNDLVVNQMTMFAWNLEKYGCQDVRIAAPPIDWNLYYEWRAELEAYPDTVKPEKVDLNGKGVDDLLGTDGKGPWSVTTLEQLNVVLPERDLIWNYINDRRHLVNGTPDAKGNTRTRGLYKPGVERLTNLVMALARFSGYAEGTLSVTKTTIADVMGRTGEHARLEVPLDLRDLELLGIITVEEGSIKGRLSKNFFSGGYGFNGDTPVITLSNQLTEDGKPLFRGILQKPMSLGETVDGLGESQGN